MSVFKEISEQWIQTITGKYPQLAKTVKTTMEQYGGVGGFIQALKDPATQEKLKTWFQDGKHFVMSHEEVQKLLGNERLKAIAEKLSTTPDAITQQLAQALPPLLEKIQKFEQSIPADSIVGKVFGTIKKKFFS